jgi:hypothetical protein
MMARRDGWLTIPEVCADLSMPEDEWPEIQAAGPVPLLGLVGPDGHLRVRRRHLERWIDALPAATPMDVLADSSRREHEHGDGRGDTS